MMTKQFETYQNNAVNTASGPQLTMMLYNGCIKFIKQAVIAMEDNDYEMKNANVQKAQDIIQELMITLDQSMDIAQHILPLYEYIHYQLQMGNIKHEKEYLEEAVTLVVEFRDTWKEALKQETPTYIKGVRV